MGKAWKFTSITLILAIVLFCFYSLNNDVALKDYHKKSESLTGALSNYFQLNSKMMGVGIRDIECDIGRDKILLSDIVKQKPTLIYRYAESGCQPCIESDLELLSERFKGSDSTRVSILSSQKSRRDYLVLKKSSKLKFPLYNFPPNSLNLKAEEYGVSYCFLLHPNMKVSDVFIPDQDNPEYTRQYFEGVQRFLKEEEIREEKTEENKNL